MKVEFRKRRIELEGKSEYITQDTVMGEKKKRNGKHELLKYQDK